VSEFTVKQGDCISSIAEKYGHFWEKLWDHPNNAELREKRKDPNVLYPGDIVFIPDKEEKQESAATEQRHRFRKNGVPAWLRLRLLNYGEPRANESYILDIDGVLFSGTTNADGELECVIPPDAKRGRLRFGEEHDEYILELGSVDPITEISGVQARLNNLGFDCGAADGAMRSETQAALMEFQKEHELPQSGEPDEKTRNKLLEAHGC
jgi:hypothetical protein